MARIRPLLNRVVIEPLQKPEKTKGGIYIPDAVDHTKGMTRGRIIEIGPTINEKIQIKIGDVVLFNKFAYTEIKTQSDDGEKTFLIVEDVKLEGVVDGEDAVVQ